MKKQLLFILMMLLPIVVWADDSGMCGDGVSFVFNESTGTLTISWNGEGNGQMYFYGASQLYSKYKKKIKTIIIENGVKDIGSSAFEGFTSLTEIVIPSSVTIIGRQAFAGCTSLASISIPNSVTVISGLAFQGCVSLSSIEILDGITEIYDKAFQGCVSLRSIRIPKSVTHIDSQVFSDCTSLVSIIVEEGNEKYDSRDNSNAVIQKTNNKLIAGCGSTKIPQSVESIGSYAFEGCSLTSVVIPQKLKEIESYAFSGCNSLTSIKVEEGNEVFDSRDNCNAIITTVQDEIKVGCCSTKIPATVKSINSIAFCNLKSLKSIIIPNNVESIKSYAFRGSNLENVIIKNVETSLYINTNGSSFSDATFQHAILYVPTGHRWDAIYGQGGWYRFNNIREIAMESRELSETRAYSLMNTNDFSLAVYDAVNGEVANASSLYDIDENNASNAWQIIKGDDDNYLYNIGARQYAGIDADGKIVLSSSPVAISLHETKNGFKLGDNNGQQWGFVINENVKPYKDLSAIDNITSTAIRDAYYTLDGQRLSQAKKGLNIVRTSDGKAKKVVMK